MDFFHMFEEEGLSFRTHEQKSFDFQRETSLQLTKKYNIFRNFMSKFGDLIEEHMDLLEKSYIVVKIVTNNSAGFENEMVVTEYDEIQRRKEYNRKMEKKRQKELKERKQRFVSKMRLENRYDLLENREDDTKNLKHTNQDFHPTNCMEVIKRQAVKIKDAVKEMEKLHEEIKQKDNEIDEYKQEALHYRAIRPRIITTFKTMNFKFNELTNGVWMAVCGHTLDFDEIFDNLDRFQRIRLKDKDLEDRFGRFKGSDIDDRDFRDYDLEYDDEDYDSYSD